MLYNYCHSERNIARVPGFLDAGADRECGVTVEVLCDMVERCSVYFNNFSWSSLHRLKRQLVSYQASKAVSQRCSVRTVL